MSEPIAMNSPDCDDISIEVDEGIYYFQRRKPTSAGEPPLSIQELVILHLYYELNDEQRENAAMREVVDAAIAWFSGPVPDPHTWEQFKKSMREYKESKS